MLLETQDNLYASFFDLSLDLLCVAGSDGFFKHLNRTWETLLGYPLAELYAQPFINFVHPDDVAPTMVEVEKLSSGVPTLQFENRYRCKNGDYKWLSWTATPVGESLYAIARDVTEKRQLEKALKRSESMLRTMFESASIAIFVVGRSGEILMLNKRAEEMFGYRREELHGQGIEDLMPERFRGRHERERETYFEAPLPRQMGPELSLIGLRKDGSEFPVETALSHVESNGETLALAFVIDVSERQRLDAERERLIEELEQYAYVISHDLRAPLRALNTYGQFLLEDYGDELDEDGRDYVTGISESAQQLEELVVGLLEYSRVGRGKQEPSRVFIGELLGKVVKRLGLRDLAQVNLPSELPVVRSYPLRLEQIFVNLLSNAVKFSRQGVSPVVSVSCVELERAWRIAVEDNGIGIEPRYQEKIFGVFQRLHTQEEYVGTGIGLAIVKKAVEEVGGEILLTSIPGAGTTFTLTLPKEEEVPDDDDR